MRKYSCSQPRGAEGFCGHLVPKTLAKRSICLFKAFMERSKGVFLSSASPFQPTKYVGMHSVAALGPSLMNAGLVGSHPVYPRASNVGRRPPEGKLEASGSPWINSLPENSKTTPPSLSGDMKESCFSAVNPVKGWNQ